MVAEEASQLAQREREEREREGGAVDGRIAAIRADLRAKDEEIENLQAALGQFYAESDASVSGRLSQDA